MGKRICEICERREHQRSGFFASFPIDENRCKEWVRVVGKEDLVYVPIEKLHRSRYVCEDHFVKKDMSKSGNRLRKRAIPKVKLMTAPLSDEQLEEFPLHVFSKTDPNVHRNSPPQPSTVQNATNDVQFSSSTNQELISTSTQHKTADEMVFVSVESSEPVKLEAPEPRSSPDIDPSSVTTRSKDDKTDIKGSKEPPASKYYCNKCNYNTYHRSVFQEHVNRHKGLKPYKCKLCPYSSVSKNYTKKHQDKHKVCPCGFVSLKNRTEFKRHLKSCTRNVGHKQRISCGKCKKEFVDDKGLATHIARMQVCSYCSEECCSLKLHLSQVHGEKKIEHKKERFECSICGWSSSLNQKILLHLIHHPAQAVDETVIDVSVLRQCGILPDK